MKIDSRDIFEQIGNLFYAIASDQHVKPLEVGELKSLISRDWLPRNLNDGTVSDETHCIMITMDSLATNQVNAKDAFDDFSRFYSLHPEVFSSELKGRILGTALSITSVFEADNPNDNRKLSMLKSLFNTDNVNV